MKAIRFSFRLKITAILRNCTVAIFAFVIGLLASPDSTYIRTSLVDISSDVKSYDGKFVEVETYAQLDKVFDEAWTAGEPFEKPEIFTFLKLSSEPRGLRYELAVELSDSQYNRVRVLIRGRVNDHCADTGGITTCCFGSSIALEDASLKQVGEIERFVRPTP